MKKRIHILGPSGSGTTTLGKALSHMLDITFYESDDIYWEETTLPYSEKRTIEERVAILEHITKDNDSWIISGSAISWGEILLQRSELIILLYCDEDIRIERLKLREYLEFGNRISEGHDMFENHRGFLDWARRYDSGDLTMRSRVSEEAWVTKAGCSILRLENRTLKSSISEVLIKLEDS